MPPQTLSARVREELLTLINSPLTSSDTSSPRLEEIARREGITVHAELLKLIAHLGLSEEEARNIWRNLGDHRADLARRLGRDVGLRVAALDYLFNCERCLEQPKIVEEALLDRTQDSIVTDPLTGLFSFGHFQFLLRCEVRRAERRCLEFSVALLDLDDFSGVNERGGRQLGDGALREVARLLQARLREIDFAARCPGPRFALLLPRTRRIGAFVAVDRIRAAVRERFLRGPLQGRRLALTLSGGIAEFPSDAETGARLLELAGESLARAKIRGNNTVVVHHAEKRGGVRFRSAGRSLRVRAFRGEGRPALVLEARELSETGARFGSAGALEAGEEVELRFLSLGPGPDLSLAARVARLQPTAVGTGPALYEVGMQFLLDRPDRRDALQAFLAGLRRQGIE